MKLLLSISSESLAIHVSDHEFGIYRGLQDHCGTVSSAQRCKPTISLPTDGLSRVFPTEGRAKEVHRSLRVSFLVFMTW